MKKKLSALLTTVVALILVVIMASGCSFVSDGKQGGGAATPSDSQIAAQTVNFETTDKPRNIEDAFIDAVAQVKRTSVQILTNSGSGSGVIVDLSFDETDDRYDATWKHSDNIIFIITCHHMVSTTGSYGTKGVGVIEVHLPDENFDYENSDYIFSGYIGDDRPSEYNSQGYAITLVGGDFESDIALLKLDLSVAATSGNKLSKDKVQKAQIPDDTYDVSLGETVFSIGNPTGTMPGSVARGIISYLNRSVSVDEIGAMSLMQIDVSTNPGSSGGGLYNLYGELIGITNAGNTSYTNINFAIPCYLENENGFVEIAKQLGGTATNDNYGYVSGRKTKLGFSVVENDDDAENPFVYVSSVGSGSLAYNQLQANDIIKTISVSRNGAQIISQSVSTLAEFAAVMDTLKAGDVLTITVSRSSWGRPTQSKTAQLEIKSFWFCDTGYYPE